MKDQLGIQGSDSSSMNGPKQAGPINWQIYNYPPLIRLIHYSTRELSPPFASLAKKMHVCALLIIANTLFNCN